MLQHRRNMALETIIVANKNAIVSRRREFLPLVQLILRIAKRLFHDDGSGILAKLLDGLNISCLYFSRSGPPNPSAPPQWHGQSNDIRSDTQNLAARFQPLLSGYDFVVQDKNNPAIFDRGMFDNLDDGLLNEVS